MPADIDRAQQCDRALHLGQSEPPSRLSVADCPLSVVRWFFGSQFSIPNGTILHTQLDGGDESVGAAAEA
jgi:hypothetical protein